MFGVLPPENYLCGNSINFHISHHDFIYLSPLSYEKLKSGRETKDLAKLYFLSLMSWNISNAKSRSFLPSISKRKHENSMLQTSLGELRDHWVISTLWHPTCMPSTQSGSLHKRHVLWDEAQPRQHSLPVKARAMGRGQHHQPGCPVEALICTWSAHAESEHRGTRTNTQGYTGRKSGRRQGQLQLAQ